MQLTTQELQNLKQLEENLWIAEFRFDKKWLENILAEDFFEFGRSGRIYTRDECLNFPAEPINATIPLKEFKLRFISRNVVQITYVSAVNYSCQTEYANRSSIWLKTAQEWKLKFHQGSAIQ